MGNIAGDPFSRLGQEETSRALLRADLPMAPIQWD